MTVRRIAAVLGLLALVLPGLAAAQGLGDAAARERARRAKQDASKKAAVLTNEDLDKGRPPSTTGETPSGPTASDGSATPMGSSSEMSQPVDGRADRERPYRDAVTDARNQVASIEARIKELGDKLNPMSGSFIYGATGSNSANEEAQVREQMREAEAELPEARQHLTDATQALEEVAQGRVSVER